MKLNKIKKQLTIRAGFWLALLVVIVGGVIFFSWQPNKKSEAPAKKTEKICLARKIDNVCADDKESQDLWPVALMIDNHPEAWPSAGLNQAQLVYNTLVEGGQTRLMAIFASNEQIKKIGPVRSARPYYLAWAKELNALYAHSGGSPEALKKIAAEKIIDCNEISGYGSLYFYRDKNKAAPHNLFTNSQNLSAAREDWELADKNTTYRPWKFSDQSSFSKVNEQAQKIAINYSNLKIFDISYQYQTSTDVYWRYQNEDRQIEANDKKPLAIKTIIIQFVPEEIHLDKDDRLAIEVLGKGAAWLMSQGKIIKGSWHKDTFASRTIFYNSNDEEIIFPTGNVWIEVVPGKREITIE